MEVQGWGALGPQRGPELASSFHMGPRIGSEEPLFSHGPFHPALVWKPGSSMGLQKPSAPVKEVQEKENPTHSCRFGDIAPTHG